MGQLHGPILEKGWNGNKRIGVPFLLEPGISDCRFDEEWIEKLLFL